MQDVTSLVLHYRDVVSSLWNTHCWSQPELKHLVTMHSYEKLMYPLFEVFVWEPIESGLPPPKSLLGPSFKIVPQQLTSSGKRVIYSMRINIEDQGSAETWQEFKGPFEEGDLQMHLVDVLEVGVAFDPAAV